MKMKQLSLPIATGIIVHCVISATAKADLNPPFGWNADLGLDVPIKIHDGIPLILKDEDDFFTTSIMFEGEPFNSSKVVGFSVYLVLADISSSLTLGNLVMTISVDEKMVVGIGGNESEQWAFSNQFEPAPYFHGYLADPATGFPSPDGLPHWFEKPIDADGLWTFSFGLENGGSLDLDFIVIKGVVITLHMIVPSPGALALFCIAGLVGTGRRRRMR